MHYILMFSLLSAPYLLHINVKLNKQIEAKHFHVLRNTSEHTNFTPTKHSPAPHAFPKKVRIILYFPI